ncbi:hypothetical protein SODG_007575 [Sodalis praecaptivus]
MRYSRFQVLNTPIERIPRPKVMRFFTPIVFYGRVASSDTTPLWGKLLAVSIRCSSTRPPILSNGQIERTIES